MAVFDLSSSTWGFILRAKRVRFWICRQVNPKRVKHSGGRRCAFPPYALKHVAWMERSAIQVIVRISRIPALRAFIRATKAEKSGGDLF